MSITSCFADSGPDAGALADRLVEAGVGALELWSIWLGRELGLYAALREDGPASCDALSASCGIAPRYAREWLEQQAVAGFLQVDDPTQPPEARRFRLPESCAAVLLDAESSLHVAPLAHMVRAIASALPAVADAYRRGTGVSFGAFGEDMAHGQGGINRPLVTHELVDEWLPAIEGLDAKLREPGARIGDVGCGVGWSTLALAKAYPEAEVVGIDLDAESIRIASEEASRRRSRAHFVRGDAAEVAGASGFDLILLFEALHDMARPVDALASLRKALAPGGSVVVVDERVAERFTAPGDLVERMMYGWSVSHCLPSGMDHDDPCPIGTALRPAEVARVAREAGFARCEEQAIHHDFFRVYRLQS